MLRWQCAALNALVVHKAALYVRCVLLSFARRLQTWRICLASTCWKRVHVTASQHCRCQVRPD